MAHKDVHHVPVSCVPGGIVEFYEDLMMEGREIQGSVQPGDWSLIRAVPQKLLDWLKNAHFANGGGTDGFEPIQAKIQELDTLKVGQRGALEVTWVSLVSNFPADSYEFINGRHRAFWLAKNGAAFVPLLVPNSQIGHFSALLV